MSDISLHAHENSNRPVWLGLGGLLFLIGLVAWVVQLRQGVGATSLSNLNAWGLYIAGFIFFMGLSAGALVLGSLPILFDLPRFRPYSRLAAYVALISLIVGGLFILVDIGRPERLWRIVRFAHLGSPMLWDLLLTVGYLIVATVFLRRLVTAKNDSELKAVALVALMAGLADGLTAFVFATQIGREFWFSAVQPMAFFTSALASASALLLLLLVVLRPNRQSQMDSRDVNPLALLTAATIGLGLLLVVSELITLSFSRSPNSTALVTAQFESRLFWIEVVLGLLAFIVLVLPALRRQPLWASVGAGLALLHLWFKRLVFVQMGFSVKNIDYAGVALAPAGPYIPNLVEWGIVVGLVGLFTLLFALGLNNLRLVPPVERG